MKTKTIIEIYNLSLQKVAEIKSPYPIDNKGNILRYSKELSDYGVATFRVATIDPVLSQFGDVLEPHRYNIRIKEGQKIVWSGAIIDNPTRNKTYVEVKAAQYDFYLDKVLIRRDAIVTAGDGKENYRTFKSGTMSAAVTDIITKAKTDFGANHPMSQLQVDTGNIENPDYPQGFTNASGAALTGGWSFTDFITLQFDYHTAYYVLKAFGVYTTADFEIDENLNFYFKKFYGNKQTGITFEYGTFGNIVDYNVPRLGQRMVNDLWGIAADNQGKILHVNQRDEQSIQTYGLLQAPEAFSDVKDTNMLKARVNEQLLFTKRSTDAPLNLIVDERAYPGQYDIGDIVTVKVKDHVIDYEQPRRIVGITVVVHNTGRKLATIQTNSPREKDLGGV